MEDWTILLGREVTGRGPSLMKGFRTGGRASFGLERRGAVQTGWGIRESLKTQWFT